MNNFKNNNRRSRFKPNGDRGFRRNGNGHKNNGDFSNGPSFKRRHPGRNNQNASKLIEKYNDLAREALSNGDKILSENYLQHSEHFSRVLITQESSRNNIEESAETNENNQINVEDDNKEIEETTTK
tara:strand:- start:55 stop:435 length:381 start_codon:yes stop_codon:yes gene_type:complete